MKVKITSILIIHPECLTLALHPVVRSNSVRENIMNCAENLTSFVSHELSQKMNCHDWLKQGPTFLKVITKSPFSPHLVNLTVKCRRWMLLGCEWQISGGLDFEPYTAIISLHLNGKRQCSVTVFSFPLLPCESYRVTYHIAVICLYGLTLGGHFRRLKRPLSHQRLRAQRRAPGLSVVYFFCTGCVCTRGKLADFAQTQMQLMEVTVRLTVSDETAGCWAEEQFPSHPTEMSQQT